MAIFLPGKPTNSPPDVKNGRGTSRSLGKLLFLVSGRVHVINVILVAGLAFFYWGESGLELKRQLGAHAIPEWHCLLGSYLPGLF